MVHQYILESSLDILCCHTRRSARHLLKDVRIVRAYLSANHFASPFASFSGTGPMYVQYNGVYLESPPTMVSIFRRSKQLIHTVATHQGGYMIIVLLYDTTCSASPLGCPDWRRARLSLSLSSTSPYGCSFAASSRTFGPSPHPPSLRPSPNPH